MFVTKIRAATDDRSVFGDFWFTPTWQASAGQRVTPARSLYLPVVYACVRVHAESMAVLPPRIYSGQGKARKLVPKHWLYDLLKKPNPYQTGFEWREMVQGHLSLRGNAYNYIQTNRSGDIVALVPKHPGRMETVPTGPGDFDYKYRYTNRDGTQQNFARQEIWHLRGLSTDGISGLAINDVGRDAIGLGLAAQTYGGNFFKNDAKPGGGWIEFAGKFADKAARQAFRDSWQESQGGGNQSKTAVLESGMKYHEIGVSNKDSQFLEARQFTVTDIARMFRVPPHLVGDLTRATFANIEQQSLEFVIYCMTAIAERWESSIETDLLLDDDKVEIEFDFSRLLRGDQAARSKFYHNGIMDGWLVRNEARMAENLEPIDGLDEPLRPLNMVEEDDAETTETTSTGQPDETQQEDNARAARFNAILKSNAERIARRIAAGKTISGEIIADAMATTKESAILWLDTCHHADELHMRASLIETFGAKP